MATDFGQLYQDAGRAWNVDPALLQSMAQVESGENPQAVSPKGAGGLMQIMPQTARGLGVTDPMQPDQAVFGAAKYMSGLLDKYGDPRLAVAAYNAGPGAVDNAIATGGSLPAETVAYVPKVTAAYQAISPKGAPSASLPAPASSSLAAPANDDAFSQVMAAAKSAAPADGQPSPSVAAPAAPSDAFTDVLNAAKQAAAPAAAVAGQSALSTIAAGLVQGGNDLFQHVNQLSAAADKFAPRLLGRLDAAFGQDPAAVAAQQQANAAQFDQTYAGNPLAKWSRIGGNLLATIPLADGLVAGAAGLLGAGGEAVAAVAPTAGRLLQGAGNVATGTIGAGKIGQAVGLATRGAATGAAASELNGGNALSGAVTGALLGPVAGVAAKVIPAAVTALPRGFNALLDAVAPVAAKDASSATAASAVPAASAASAATDAAGTADAGAELPADVATIKTITVAPDGTAQMQETPATPAAPQPAISLPPASPFGVRTPDQAAARADAIIASTAKGGPTDLPSAQIIPGSNGTLGTIGNANLATLERSLRASDPQQFAALDTANATARQSALSNLIGTPQQIEAMQAAREAQTSALRDAAFANTTPVDAQPVVSQLNDLIASNKGRSTVQAPLQAVRDEITGLGTVQPDGSLPVDPQHLYNLRQYLGDMVAPRAAGTANDAQAAAAQLLSLKPTIDTAIESGAPGFQNYMQKFEQMSRPIDGQQYLQNLNLTDGNGNTTLAKLDSAIKGLARAQGKNGVQLADSVTPDQAQQLFALREDMRQSSMLMQGKAPGSNTFQNFATSPFMKGVGTVQPLTMGEVGGHAAAVAANPLIGAVSIATRGAQRVIGAQAAKGEDLVRQALIQRFVNPQLAAGALQSAAAP